MKTIFNKPDIENHLLEFAFLLVMSPGQKIWTRVYFFWLGSVRVSHLWFGFENFP